MRRTLLPVGLLALGIAAAAQSAAGSGGKTVQIPLPAVQASSVTTFTVAVKGSHAIAVRTANDAALGNLGLVYAVGRPAKPGGAWSVAVFVKRFTAQRRTAGAQGGTVDLEIDTPSSSTVVFRLSRGVPAACSAIEAFDKGFEGGASVNLNGMTFTLQNGRTPSEQPSPPEEVMDNVIAGVKSCSFTPEGDDPGNK